MAWRKCLMGCGNRVREGLIRHVVVGYGKDGKPYASRFAVDGSELADGRTCWRCRRKQRERKGDRKT